MRWSNDAGVGFTQGEAEPWLPVGTGPTVAQLRDDSASTLVLCRDLLALRRERSDLRRAPYASLPSPDGVWAWSRGDRYAVAVNLGDDEAVVEELEGAILVGTNRERDGERVSGLRLAPAEGALLET